MTPASAPGSAPHLLPLGASGWQLWRDVLLRGAGFPARLVHELADPQLAMAANAVLDGSSSTRDFRAVFDASVERLRTAVRDIAADRRFREAVTWQNRALVATCLDKAAAGERRNKRGRDHEKTIAAHLQRYALKNDTIGFFGPTGWASWTDAPQDLPLRVVPGPRLLARRTVYFESWAIDALARALAADPALRPWLVPRRDPAVVLDGDLARRPYGAPLRLTAAETMLLKACDAGRPVRELIRELVGAQRPFPHPADLTGALARFEEHGLAAVDLEGPIEAWPERTLRHKLAAIGDPEPRERALAVLDRLLNARRQVAAAAGDPDALASAMDRLNSTFEDITGQEAVRLHGQTYASRTLVYEDTVRDVRVALGARLRGELAGALGPVLDSARWLVGRIATEYEALFHAIHREWSASRSGPGAMPLAALLEIAAPHLVFSLRTAPAPVRAAVGEFQERWARVLDALEALPPGEAAGPQDGTALPQGRTALPQGGTAPGARRTFSSGRLAGLVREEFPPAPPPWSAAIHHAPDLMIAAASAEAVGAGDYQVVLGELHVSFNTLENRAAVEQHPDPGALMDADAADHAGQRVYMIPPRENWWLSIGPRLTPPSALMGRDTVYWTTRHPCVEPTGPVLALADLSVHSDGEGRLVVRDGAGTFRAPLLEVLSEPLSGVAVNSFAPFAPARHRPRVTVDRLVLARESWSFPVADLSWTALRDEPERYLGARAWRGARALPDRLFYTSPAEDKPMYADFTSPALVNLFATAVRRAAVRDADAVITLTETLPDADETWLTDAAGERYTAELRVIAVDPLRTRRRAAGDRDPLTGE
ncbi:lantibiotic dehydratase [Streptomyces sp. MST-110588]|uniref:lantibiotic dehydratase n=1 Tax=Streptomyces sp. MST-110588 TaxID=2833628 RepID=UPI001F5C8B41|nr:lantibiotic dehydratase [Streptomyces sp. MST-110588]UNO43342.1 lantibiotic dehydratase [Streptomyces sp. MST-110588]